MDEGMDEGFSIPPPDLSGEGYRMPVDQHAAMTLKLIKHKIDTTLLPQSVKDGIYTDVNIFVNNASMTNITLGQVKEFLWDFDYVWGNYTAFINRTYKRELNYLKAIIRTILKQNLNKSKEGFYPSLVFEQRYRYDIKQHREPVEEKVRGWFRKKPKEEQETPRGGG